MSSFHLLGPFSFGVIGVIALLIIVPYLRGKSDLLTTWNLFLVGSANFIGLAGVKAAYESERFRILEYTNSDYELFMLGAVVFLTSLVLTYRFVKFPRRIAGRFFRKWPPSNSRTLYGMLLISLVLAALAFKPPPIQGVAQVVSHVGNKATIIAVVLAFAAWCRSKSNLVLLATLLTVLLAGLLIGVLTGGGRRTILGVAIAIPIAYYWLELRYRSPTTNIAVLGVTSFVMLLALGAYSTVRHFDRQGEKKERNVANAMEALLKIPKQMLNSDVDQLAGQNAAQTALAAIHVYTREEDPVPFHSVFYVGTIYIPRAFWPDKPKGLGYTLPKTVRAKGTRATWGPNVIGHGFHEGGLHMLVFYGFLAAVALRFVDEMLVRQSTNPYLLAFVSASSGHILGWTRGDIGTFTVQIISAVLAILFVSWIGRLMFGTGVVYPRTDDPYFVNQNLFRQPVAYY
ncbi:MAG: hypothetical protein AAGF31_01975 [Planctomycetota bacterium]